MEVFGFASLFGLILGFMFGVGCAAAVMYTIYMGGYKKALQDHLTEPRPKRYFDTLAKVREILAAKSESAPR